MITVRLRKNGPYVIESDDVLGSNVPPESMMISDCAVPPPVNVPPEASASVSPDPMR